MGYSNPDKEAQLDYHAFAKVCKQIISDSFKAEALRRKA